MLKYKHVVTANGRDMYFKNGKMVKKADIPAEILPRLEDGVELQMGSQPEADETVDEHASLPGESESEVVGKDCIFCGKEATKQRFVNLKIAPLCEDDYESHTTGEIAAQINEVLKTKE